MKNVIITVDNITSEILDCSTDEIGVYKENLQGKLSFVFEEEEKLIDGVAWLEYEINGVKNYSIMTKNSDNTGYEIDIISALLTGDTVKVNLRITETQETAGIPVFKSKEKILYVASSIDATTETPQQYPTWIDTANQKIAQADNLNITATRVSDGVNVNITSKEGITTTTKVYDGQSTSGIPTGGLTGQVLKKKSNADYDVEWGAGGSGSGNVDDVKVDGVSVVSEGIANIDLTGKVDKETGKGLSTNDYTTTEKTKLAGISESAKNVSVSASGTATDTVQYITIDGVEKKLAGSGGEPSEYVKSATVSDNNITFVDKDDTETSYNPDFSKVGVSQSGTSTDEIGYITIDGTEYKIPHSESGEPLAYLKSASVSGATLTLTNKDDSTVAFTKQVVNVSNTGTATDTVSYITIDGVEKKLAGEEYTAGTGINISNDEISVDTGTIATNSYVDTKSTVSVETTGTATDNVKFITIDNEQHKLATGATNYYSEVEPTDAVIGDLWTFESGSDTDYLKSASVNNNKLTLVDQNDTEINYEPAYTYEGTYSSSNPIATKSYVDGKISSALIYKGSCNYSELPATPNVGDVWNVLDAHGTYPAGTNYAWNGTEWSPLGGSLDLSGYATTTQLSSGLASKQNTLTAGSGIRITNNVISNTVDSSTFATQSQVSNKLSKYGDTLEGELVVKGTLNPTFTGDSSTGAITMYGGKYDGAKLRLNGASCSTETSQPGGFMLKAEDTNESCTLVGLPNRKLLWHDSMVLTTDGGENINSPLILSTNKTIAKSDVETSYTLLYGGTDNTSAYLGLCGKDRSGNDSGMFALHARNSSGHKILRGQPDGKLTWDGHPVASVPESVTLTTLHSKIDWVRANVYKVGQLVTANISFRAKGAIAQSAYILSGFPLPIAIAGGEGMEVIVIFGSGYRKAKLWDDGRMQMSTGACSSGNVYTMNFSYVCQA